jgi:hypothetical protein
MTVLRALTSLSFALWLATAPNLAMARPQDPPEKKAEETKPDTFFAGTVIETTAERLTVSRVVLGKTEKRSFRVTADTKCEGKLKAKVRVTVRYVTSEDGDTAELIVVRSQQKKTKQQ